MLKQILTEFLEFYNFDGRSLILDGDINDYVNTIGVFNSSEGEKETCTILIKFVKSNAGTSMKRLFSKYWVELFGNEIANDLLKNHNERSFDLLVSLAHEVGHGETLPVLYQKEGYYKAENKYYKQYYAVNCQEEYMTKIDQERLANLWVRKSIEVHYALWDKILTKLDGVL